MEYWQTILLNLAIIGLTSQVLHIFIIFLKSKSSSNKDKAKDGLEQIYNQSSFSGNHIRDLKF